MDPDCKGCLNLNLHTELSSLSHSICRPVYHTGDWHSVVQYVCIYICLYVYLSIYIYIHIYIYMFMYITVHAYADVYGKLISQEF